MNDTNTATLADAIVAEAQAETSAPVETTTNDAPTSSEAPASKPKRVRKAKKSKPADKPAGLSAVIKRDAWHVKVNGSGHVINSYLRKQAGKPRTIAEIHEATTEKGGRATAGATRGHVMFLLARGFVKLKDGGYVVSKKGAKPAGDSKPAVESEAETGDE